MTTKASPPSIMTAPISALAHNALSSVVALYGEVLADQEKKLQAYAAQLGHVQQQCAQLTEACRLKDATIKTLEEKVKRAQAYMPIDDEFFPGEQVVNDSGVEGVIRKVLDPTTTYVVKLKTGALEEYTHDQLTRIEIASKDDSQDRERVASDERRRQDGA